MSDSKTRMALVDDHAMVREALASILAGTGSVEVVAQGSNTQDALRILREVRPDILLLDYNMPGGGALPVLEAQQGLQSSAKILILTVHDSWHYAVRVLEAGAQGFMVKASAVDELQEAIERIERGEIYITPSLSQKVLDHLRRPRDQREGLASLSQREFEILRALGSGLGIKEAALSLKISVSTASTYRARVMKKLGLSSTGELIRFTIEQGIVE